MASAPAARPKRASSASSTPLRMSLPGQRLLTHSTSRQLADASNCVAVHSANVRMALEPPMRPAKFPKVRRLPNSTLSAQEGFEATSRPLRNLQRGGGRVDEFLIESAIFHEVLLDPERLLSRGSHSLDGANRHGSQA